MTSTTAGTEIIYTTDNVAPALSNIPPVNPLTGDTGDTTLVASTTATLTISSPGTTIIQAKTFTPPSTVSNGTATLTVVITLTATTPTFSPAAGTFTAVQSVTITDSTDTSPGIAYTTDGSLPTSDGSGNVTNGTRLANGGSVSIGASTTLKAISFVSGFADSPAATGVYTINIPGLTNAPTFSPPPGTYTSAQTVTISTTTPGASIRFTTDGSTPSTTVGTLISPPGSGTTSGTILVSAVSTPLSAIAFEAGNSNSTVTSGVYTIPLVGPTNLNVLDNQTVTAGHNANFIASVTANPTPTILWQISTNGGATFTTLASGSGGVLINGSGTFLTLSNVSLAQSGNEFRYVVTNSGGSATSNVATLTVIAAQFPSPSCITVDAAGNLYVGDSSNNTIQLITPAGLVSLIAGSTGSAGSKDGTGTDALFRQPGGIIVNSFGTLFVADTGNSTIRQILPGGVVTTLAGSPGNQAFQDGSGAGAFFNMPVGIALDTTGNLFVTDKNNDVIRKISGGTVTTLAGTAGSAGSNDGIGAAAQFHFPTGIAIDGSNKTYVADTFNDTIRKVTLSSGNVVTLAGLASTSGSSDGSGNAALFNLPGGAATDSAGNVYIADTANDTIRMMTSGGTVTTLAGLAGIAGLADGTGSNALFNQPEDVTVDSAGNVYVADTGNAAIRKIAPGGIVTTLTTVPAPPPLTGNAAGVTKSSTAPVVAGGGAMDSWFVSVLAIMGLLQWRRKRRA
ncbi:MAG TPA: chitobiase/beta-hexosaminidase C-terminal domain-containing protein [Candidatus Acidoferrales bacterium]|nr:chitobiase/beta-hexosaminidase C-terminal domain-containing protein [Candidatus Acidoferrales bacterium]